MRWLILSVYMARLIEKRIGHLYRYVKYYVPYAYAGQPH